MQKQAPLLTVGMAHHSDFPGVWMSVQNIRLQLENRPDLLSRIEFVVVDNGPSASPHGKAVLHFLNSAMPGTAGVQYVPLEDSIGTSPPRNRIFEVAHGEIVLAMDCHVLLAPGALESLLDYFQENPDSQDLIQGPMLYDQLNNPNTHFENIWRAEMWGVWGEAWRCNCGSNSYFSFSDKSGHTWAHRVSMGMEPVTNCPDCNKLIPTIAWVGHEIAMEGMGFMRIGLRYNPDEKPFEIPGQGLGLFACRREAWLGFHPLARGFGGEEMYIHEKYRKAGHKALCLPQLRWLHRFGRADAGSPPYPLTRWGKIRNYVLEFKEIGRDYKEIYDHFVAAQPPLLSQQKWEQLIADPERLQEEGQCKTCGQQQVVPAFGTLDDLYNAVLAKPRDLEQHMPKLRELAAKCRTVTEISNRRESTIAILAAQPRLFRSYNTDVDGFVEAAKRLSDPAKCTYWHQRQSDSKQIPSIEETDMLFIDTEHTYAALKSELDKYGEKVKRYIVLHDTDAFGMTGQGMPPTQGGMLGAVIEFVQSHPEFSTVFHSKEQYGLTVLSCHPDDKPKLPSKITMAANFAKAMAVYAASGFEKSSKEVFEKRLEICSICPQRSDDRCTVCGCFIAPKAEMAAQNCPLAFWTAEGGAA